MNDQIEPETLSLPQVGAPALVAAGALPLQRLCTRAWHLARALPDEPLEALARALNERGIAWAGPEGNDLEGDDITANTGALDATETEAMVRRRIGQDVFREALIDYWNGRCPLTGIAEPALLRASHIVPWSACASDAQRLDVHNGLLLSALWDAAFDAGLVTFDNEGRALAAPALSAEGRAALRLDQVPRLEILRDRHRVHLAWHRDNVFSGGRERQST